LWQRQICCAAWAPHRYLFSVRLPRAGCGPAPTSKWPSRGCLRRSTFRPSARHQTSSDDRSISSIWTSRHPWFAISSEVGNWFVSSDLADKLRLSLGEPATVREQFAPLICLPETSVGVIERAARCAMPLRTERLHSGTEVRLADRRVLKKRPIFPAAAHESLNRRGMQNLHTAMLNLADDGAGANAAAFGDESVKSSRAAGAEPHAATRFAVA